MAQTLQGAHKAQHTRQLGKPQAFNLTGDGDAVDETLNSPHIERDLLGGKLADARYRDWQSSQGEIFARYRDDDTPEFQLTAESPSRGVAANGNRDARLRDAMALLRDLCDEFADLFPDEYAKARAFLGGDF
jgi:hypothetical protein